MLVKIRCSRFDTFSIVISYLLKHKILIFFQRSRIGAREWSLSWTPSPNCGGRSCICKWCWTFWRGDSKLATSRTTASSAYFCRTLDRRLLLCMPTTTPDIVISKFFLRFAGRLSRVPTIGTVYRCEFAGHYQIAWPCSIWLNDTAGY